MKLGCRSGENKVFDEYVLLAIFVTECHQASLDWRSLKIVLHYRTTILGTDDFKYFEKMACIGTWSFCYMCNYEFGQIYGFVIVKGLIWYLAM
ncbi:tRNA guanosine-2'-O-methyltransferase TRM13 [Gossypium arboreum]|uniref:tRNA guanosine-2'-O-methyltransferase TRM13 n=1 Tax=Gossypium arboreum TaxID=29729 RepID=A0A0B0MBW7_GOSAR|nr:tRNA guanosine-2'-O-methyltransferase TRM13 [Gossypium arboreum]